MDKFFHSAPDFKAYVKSLTSVPGSIGPENRYRLCHCLPISKASYDTLTQAGSCSSNSSHCNCCISVVVIVVVVLVVVNVDDNDDIV